MNWNSGLSKNHADNFQDIAQYIKKEVHRRPPYPSPRPPLIPRLVRFPEGRHLARRCRPKLWQFRHSRSVSVAVRSDRHPCSHPRQKPSTSSTSTSDTARSCSSRPSRWVCTSALNRERGWRSLAKCHSSDLSVLRVVFSLRVMN